jgi:ElaB/YqjD/DUF883 family membrane-anchored ribosome-binding protein
MRSTQTNTTRYTRTLKELRAMSEKVGEGYIEISSSNSLKDHFKIKNKNKKGLYRVRPRLHDTSPLSQQGVVRKTRQHDV